MLPAAARGLGMGARIAEPAAMAFAAAATPIVVLARARRSPALVIVSAFLPPATRRLGMAARIADPASLATAITSILVLIAVGRSEATVVLLVPAAVVLLLA